MKVTFSFDVPNWIYRYRWNNVKNYTLFYLQPYRCEDCNKRMPFKHYDIWRDTTPQLGLSYGKCVCPSCLQKRLDALTVHPKFVAHQQKESYNVAKKCGVCGTEATSYKSIRMSAGILDSLRFCANGSWNGTYVCLHCVKDALTNGKMRSSYYGVYHSKMVPLNGRGLPVVDGKVKFPEK